MKVTVTSGRPEQGRIALNALSRDQGEHSPAYWVGFLESALEGIIADLRGGALMASARLREERWSALYRNAQGKQRSAGTFDTEEEALARAKVAELDANPPEPVDVFRARHWLDRIRAGRQRQEAGHGRRGHSAG